MRFSYIVAHVAAKDIATVVVLSRVPVNSTTEGLQEEEINPYVDSACYREDVREIQTHQDKDDILDPTAKKYSVEGWPDKSVSAVSDVFR